MKILAISHEYPPIGGGGANAASFLLSLFAKKGHEVTLVTVGMAGMKKEEHKGKLRILRVPSKRKHKEHCSFTEMLDFIRLAGPVCEKLQKSDRFDICLVFFGIPSGPVGVKLKKKYNLPFVIRFGGGDVPGFQERFTKIYKMLGPSIKNIWRKADARIANSEGLRELAYNFYDKEEFLIIPNGVDQDTFYPGDGSTKDEGCFEILFVSRLIERKGLQFVIPQLSSLRDNIEAKGERLHLTIVGDGPYRETLLDLAKENGVSDIISFEGQKDKNQLLPYYQRADVFILPSAKEGMPNVVLEAEACGLPIVMTPCQGSKELVGDNGYVCGTEEFGEKLLELAKNPFSRKIMGELSLERVRENFTWEKAAEDYLEIMQRIVIENKK